METVSPVAAVRSGPGEVTDVELKPQPWVVPYSVYETGLAETWKIFPDPAKSGIRRLAVRITRTAILFA